jgi:ppGpp synthetase/RelA/SpoT-type nucleotidyltranferase
MSAGAAVPNLEALRREYDERRPRYEQLCEVVVREVRRGLERKGIEAHSLSYRVKAFHSFAQKVRDKRYEDPWKECHDLAGVRVVCLYRGQMAEAKEAASDVLNVISAKQHGSPDPKVFEYRDWHCVADGLRPGHASERERKATQGLRCELQIRTAAMDAWDAVSHHLAYVEKQRADLPTSLKRDFHALNAMLYVADSEFERLRLATRQHRLRFFRGKGLQDDDLLDCETWRVLLERLYPERTQSPLQADLRMLAYEFRRNDVLIVGEARCILEGAEPALAELERRWSALGHGPFVRESATRLSAMLARRGWRCTEMMCDDLRRMVEPVAQEFRLRDSQ